MFFARYLQYCAILRDNRNIHMSRMEQSKRAVGKSLDSLAVPTAAAAAISSAAATAAAAATVQQENEVLLGRLAAVQQVPFII